jgi:hypothetical protein
MYMAISQTTWGASVYFVSLIVVGNYILFNLFLAILLSQFGDDQDEDEEEESDEEEGEENAVEGDPEAGYLAAADKDNERPPGDGEPTPAEREEEEKKAIETLNPPAAAAASQDDNQSKKSSVSFAEPPKPAGASGSQTYQRAKTSKKEEEISKKRAKYEESKRSKIIIDEEGKSCYIFDKNSCIVQTFKSLILHPYYDEFIYSLIAASSITLAIDEPNVSDYKS